jgi:hypothetical protein
LFILSFNLSFIFAARSLCPALERDGLKGSLAKFGFSVGFAGFAPDDNIGMPCSEGMVGVCLDFRIICIG